jgi:hypothetical protein
MSTHPGFRDTRLHRAPSPEGRFQLVNVAHWDSAESYAAARGRRRAGLSGDWSGRLDRIGLPDVSRRPRQGPGPIAGCCSVPDLV